MSNKSILLRLLSLVVLVFAANGAFADSSNYFSKITATTSGAGKVYVEEKGKQSVISADAINQQSQTLQQESSDSWHFYTVYAKPEAGYAFKEWAATGTPLNGVKLNQAYTDDNPKNTFTKTDNPLSVRINISEKGESKAPESILEAQFVPTTVSVSSNNYSLGSASIDKVENSVGDQVTVKAVFNTPHATWQDAEVQNHSKSVTFEGWFDENGSCLSEDENYTFAVEKQGVIEARYSREFVFNGAKGAAVKGYYRMQPAFRRKTEGNKFLCVTGNFSPKYSMINGSYLNGVMQYNQVPYSFSKTYSLTDSVFADAGSIIYVTGEMESADATVAYTKVVSNIVAEAQGVTTTTILSSVSKNISPWLVTSNTQGFYMLYLIEGVTLQWTSSNNEQVYVSKDHLDESNLRDCGDFDVQPVDLEHIDTNYFGAYASEDMAFDGGYWTSMYTSFPYECYEADGVEAYVVNGSVTDDEGVTRVTVELLEGGIVPAATPVLLKCRGILPVENRLIPLLPDDSRLAEAEAACEGNLLGGDYGLWTSSDYKGRPKYDDGTMRVFSVGSDGELGFYRLAAADDGSARELVPNRAYLDLSKLSAGQSAPAAVRIAFGTAGIGNVAVEESAAAPAEYYNLQGMRVHTPVAGNIYIERRGKQARKVLYK